ncbi:MAG: DNA alkylation repair protein [Clostridia bacterium]|nr:DNA alkylation repair protein [Clostridia bacterium]MDE7329289.1 DNA alkylation repair protein [Clostridia bacterium]
MRYSKEDLDKFIEQNCDEKYRAFHSRLTRSKYPIFGVRVPILRAYGKELSKCENVDEFLNLPIERYEQAMLKGVVLSYIKREDAEYFALLEKFFLQIDDWAVCDISCGGVKRKDDAFLEKCLQYAGADHVWTARWGIVQLFSNFYDRSESLRSAVYGVKAKDYYIDMAIAWLIQVLAVKNAALAKEFLASEKISDAVKSMAVRKIKDSFRISAEEKEYFARLAKRI